MSCGDQDNKALILEIINDAIGHDCIGRENINKVKQLYKCIQDGKVHIGGCIPINESVNQTLEVLAGKMVDYKLVNGPAVRVMVKRFNLAMKAGDLAHRRYDICNREFHEDLRYAVDSMDDEVTTPRQFRRR